MNESPAARARVGLTGLTVAEHFRDAEGQYVLLFIDNIFRFTQGLDNHGFQAFEFYDLDNLKGSTKAASKEFEKIDQLFNVYADKSSGTIE